MKYRILALLPIIILAIFACKESTLVDLDAEATKAWASVYIAKDGDVEFIENLASQLEIREYQVVANTALRAAEKIKNPRSKKYDNLPYSKDIYRIIFSNKDLDKPNMDILGVYESRVDIIKSKTEKTKLYAKLAKLYNDKGDAKNYNRLIAKAFDMSLPLPALVSRNSLAFALDIVVKLDDANNYFKYAPKSPDCYAKNMVLLSTIKSPKIAKELIAKRKDVVYKKSAKYKYSDFGYFANIEWRAKSLKPKDYGNFNQHYIYMYLGFFNPWGAKDWKAVNNPIFAFHAYLRGRKEMYDYFKEHSLNETQMENVRRIYKEYVDYCACILLAMGDTQDAVSLIKTLDNDAMRNNSLRKNLVHILKNPDGLDVLKAEGLL